MSIQLRDGFANRTLDHVLEDLLVRFLVNAPNEDLSSSERVLFQVEEAQWFYTDFIRQTYPGLPAMKMRSFSTKMLEKCPLIWKWGDSSEALSKFGKYKSSIPVRGIALFNSDLTKMVLVKGYESSSWSFPRGKISKDEQDIECAVREVEEETGFNAAHLISEKNVVDRTIKGKNYKIYLVSDVPEDFDFKPKVRNEIEKIEWFDIKSLQKKIKNNPSHYFILPAVLKPMMRWVNDTKGTVNEADLMVEAEVKLKNLMGIGKEVESSSAAFNEQADNDAGRELLDILQGVKPVQEPSEEAREDGSESPKVDVDVPVTVNIPQSMAAPYAHLMDINVTSSLPTQNSFNLPFYQNAQAMAPKMDQSISTPTPESLEKPPTSLMNSRELLSILTSKESKPKDSPSQDYTRSQDASRNKAKAQELLKLFKKDSSSETPESENDTELEQEPEPKPKVTLLKRSDDTEKSNPLLDMLRGNRDSPKPNTPKSPSSPANDLLSLLKRSSTPSTPKAADAISESSNRGPSSSHANDLLGMLKRPDDTVTDSPAPSASPASDLLGMLKGPRSKPTATNEPVAETPKDQDAGHKAGSELLGLLNKKPTQAVLPANEEPVAESAPNNVESGVENDEDFEDFEQFEDFEDFDALSHEIEASKDEYQHEEVEEEAEQPDQEFYDASEKPETQAFSPPPAVIPQQNSFVPSDPYEQYQQFQQPTFDEQVGGPSKGNVRLLKPGQSLSSLLESSPKVEGANGGNDLLALLQRKPSQQSPLATQSQGHSSVYGTSNSASPLVPVTDPLAQSPNAVSQVAGPFHNQQASNSLLSLLNKGSSSSPSGPPAPPPTTQDSPSQTSNSKAAANNLLSLLRRPDNE